MKDKISLVLQYVVKAFLAFMTLGGFIRLVIPIFVLFCVGVSLIPSSESNTDKQIAQAESSTISETLTATAEIKTEKPTASEMEVRFIDVGQADAALVLCDGKRMLIDGGNTSDSSLIYTYLKNLKVDYLDYIVATHAHEDHVGGLAGALNYAAVGNVYCPVTAYDSEPFNDFKKYVEKVGASISVPSVGDSFDLGGAVVDILGVNGGSEVNDTSIILKITYGDTAFLFTGDAEQEAEQAVLNNGCNLSATVLKVGHHGSANSTTYPFLREVMPAYAVISVGEDNGYGHPADDALSRLRDAGVKVYRTDLQGDIIAKSDGKSVTITVEKNPDADTLKAQVTQAPVAETNTVSNATPEPKADAEPKDNYAVNGKNGKIHIVGDCPATGSGKNAMKEPVYFATYEEAESYSILIAPGEDKRKCGNCWK